MEWGGRNNIATMLPAHLMATSAKLKLCTFTGETILTLGIAVLFVLWFPVFYDTSDWRTWLCIIWLTVVAGYVTPKMVKKYLTLFKQLSSVKE